MGKTCTIQPVVLSYNVQQSTGLDCLPICIPFPDWWQVQALFCTGQNQEKDTGEYKKESQAGPNKLWYTHPSMCYRDINKSKFEHNLRTWASISTQYCHVRKATCRKMRTILSLIG